MPRYRSVVLRQVVQVNFSRHSLKVSVFGDGLACACEASLGALCEARMTIPAMTFPRVERLD